jgi:transcription termination factor Rho
MDEQTLRLVWLMRRMLAQIGNSTESLEPLLNRLNKSSNNREFLTGLMKDKD